MVIPPPTEGVGATFGSRMNAPIGSTATPPPPSAVSYTHLLLKFLKYEDGSRTPLEEHLVEGALYAANKNGKVNVHFTVSPEHRASVSYTHLDVYKRQVGGCCLR